MRRLAVLLLVLFLSSGAAYADAGQGMVRVRVDPSGPVVPGQTVRLVVEALTTTWFTGAPVFPELSIPGAVVSAPSVDANNLNTDIDGVRWFGLSRSYAVTVLKAGDLSIPPITLMLTMGPDGQASTVSSAPLHLTVSATGRPPGAENAVATTGLTVEQHFSRDLAELAPGDAFTRTVITSAASVPAIQLPPVEFHQQPGLAVYPAAPSLVDGVAKGNLSSRVDTATYVVQKPGDYTLRGIATRWWDIPQNRLQTAEVPAVRFTVSGAAAVQAPAAVTVGWRLPDSRLLIGLIAAACMAAVVLWLAIPHLLHWAQRARADIDRARASYAASEVAAYRDLVAALRKEDRDGTVRALYRWLDKSAMTVPETGRFLDDVYGRSAHTPDFSSLRRAIVAAHHAHKKKRAAGQNADLPDINPVMDAPSSAARD